MFQDFVFLWLDNALDAGISECEFWNMTIAELQRAMQSKKRMMMADQKARASFDYILADLIGRSVARVYNSKNRMPAISDIYPTLFEAEETTKATQQKKDEVSSLRFKLFAQSHNSKIEGVEKEK